MRTLPTEMRRSVTFDNGTEFVRHYGLHELKVETFFYDIRSPWRKGGVENATRTAAEGIAADDGLG